MASVILDIVDGSSARNTYAGLEMDRIAKVAGLTGIGSQRLIEALQVTGMPALGDAHPTVSNMYVAERHPRAVKPAVVEVRLLYRSRKIVDIHHVSIEVGTALKSVERNRDKDGKDMTVTYNGTSQGLTITDEVPVSTMVCQRTESRSPGYISRLYVNKVNSVVWNLDPSSAAREWKCQRIVGVSEDLGATYDVTYEFQHDIDKWVVEGFYIDPETGRPPSDAVTGNGKVTYDLKDAIDFNKLNLTSDNIV